MLSIDPIPASSQHLCIHYKTAVNFLLIAVMHDSYQFLILLLLSCQGTTYYLVLDYVSDKGYRLRARLKISD